jgi:hypothetical protein
LEKSKRQKPHCSLDQDQGSHSVQIAPTDRGCFAGSRLDLAAWRRGKQDAAIVDQALKAMRGHIQCCDIERVFVSRLRLGALVLQNSVYLALDLRQV